MKKNPAAVALGRMARGIPKTITADERAARSLRLAKARESRWPKKRTPKAVLQDRLDAVAIKIRRAR